MGDGKGESGNPGHFPEIPHCVTISCFDKRSENVVIHQSNILRDGKFKSLSPII